MALNQKLRPKIISQPGDVFGGSQRHGQGSINAKAQPGQTNLAFEYLSEGWDPPTLFVSNCLKSTSLGIRSNGPLTVGMKKPMQMQASRPSRRPANRPQSSRYSPWQRRHTMRGKAPSGRSRPEALRESATFRATTPTASAEGWTNERSETSFCLV